VGNLESCFHDGTTGHGDVLAAPSIHVGALSHLGFHVLGVANNHCGPAAAVATRELLAPAGIGTVGIGPPLEDASMLEHGGLRVALGALVVLPTTSANVAGIMTDDVARRLRRLREAADFLLVTIHWGEEYRRQPTPPQRALSSWLMENGASGILGHHSHVVSEVEEREGGGFVAYSLGNFLFDQEGHVGGAGGATEEGLVLQVRLHATLGVALRRHPVRIVDRHCVEPAPP
jgi:poly-gamma-glutamate synthesis protein (capsule biosynthesis protein)